MELILTRLDTAASQVTVTCDGQLSHTFGLSALIPSKPSGLPHPIDDPVTYGNALYAALFPPGSLAQQALAAKPKRLLLIAADDELDSLPWEYAYGPGGFVVCTCTFVRGLPAEQQIAPPDMLSGLYIVTVASSPLSRALAPLNIQGEWTRLTEIVGDLNRAVTLERAWPPTITRLRALVAGQQQRVIHFMGHGGRNEEGKAVLYFELENGAREDITASEFVSRVQGSVSLVTLNACGSAKPGETVFDNLAKALVREQVPYALGMRFFVHDDDALAFSRDFYSDLARGVSVEEAVRQSRLTLVKSKRAWAVGVPVLYTALTASTFGYATEPGEPRVQDAQEDALHGIIGVLPEVPGAFQGRIDEQITLGAWLTADRRPLLITIHGSAGQGKTALARVTAERFAHAWPGGVWATSLESIPTRATFVIELARFLGLNIQETADTANLERQVLLHMRRRRTLLVLDNMETLIAAIETRDASALDLVAFIQQLPGPFVSLLITSRHILGWPGEVSLELSGLSPDEGAALFRQSAPQRASDIEKNQARQISQRLDGHPFGLFLLGRAFNDSTITVPALLADYEDQLLASENKYVGVDHRQRTLYGSIETSVRYLPPDLRSLLSKLWLFHAPFLLETAIAIFDPEGKAREDERSPVADQLYALWQRGLLNREKASHQDLLLYRVPPVIRPYIERYLAEESERERLLAQYGSTYARLASSLFDQLDRDALAHSLAFLWREDLERGISYVQGSERLYYLMKWGRVVGRLGDHEHGLLLLERALEMAQEQEHHDESVVWISNALAEIDQTIGRPQEALRLYETALPIAKGLGDRDSEAATLNNMAEVYRGTGHPQEALHMFQQALVISQETGDRAAEAFVLGNMASISRKAGHPREALQLYEQALLAAHEGGNRVAEAKIVNDVAGVLVDTGSLPDALELYEQALTLRREVGDRRGEADTLNEMAGVYVDSGSLPDALELYEQALTLRREVGDRPGEATTLNDMALTYNRLGRTRDALQLYEQALTLRREVGDRPGEATTMTNIALIYDQAGRTRDALELYEQALTLRREVGDRSGEATTLNDMANAYYAMHRSQEVLQLLEQALHIQKEIENPAGEAATLSNMAALLYRDLHQPQEAIRKMEQALAILREAGLPQDAGGDTQDRLAGYLRAMKDGLSSRVQENRASTMPIEHINTIIEKTISVMTALPEQRAKWRVGVQQALENAQQQGANWQIEVEFFTAILAILDGESPSLPADHPYASAIDTIEDGIAKGELEPVDNEIKVIEGPQALAWLVQASVSALRSTDPQEKMAGIQQLAALQGQVQDNQMKTLFHAIQRALSGDDLAHLGDDLSGFARQIWDRIVASVQQDNTAPPESAVGE